MKNVAGAEVWLSFDHLSDAEFLKLVNETIEFIALDTSIPFDPTEVQPFDETDLLEDS